MNTKELLQKCWLLLTVHLSIFVSVINQLDAQNFCFTIRLFHASTCFEHKWSKHVEAWNKLIVKRKCCASSWLITEINSIKMLRKLNRGWLRTLLWGRHLRPRGRKWQTNGERCINGSFVICNPHPKLGWSDQGEWDEWSTWHTW